MTLTLYSMFMITCTLTMLIASTPIILGINILLMALLLSVMFACFMSSWFAFLIFLIYIGGMLVMFAYFMAITPNLQPSSSNYMIYSLLTLTTLLMLIMFMDMMLPNLMNFINGNTIMYLMNFSPMLIILASILLLMMIIVVKITSQSKGPLRPFM